MFNGKVALYSVGAGFYVCAEGGGGGELIANREQVGPWETFEWQPIGATHAALRAANGQYVCAEGGGGGALVANRPQAGAWETFEVHTVPDQQGTALGTSNGSIVRVERHDAMRVRSSSGTPMDKFTQFLVVEQE